MLESQTAASSLFVDVETGTPERLSGDDKVPTLSALPRGPLSEPVGDDKVEKPVSAFHSAEGDAEVPPATAVVAAAVARPTSKYLAAALGSIRATDGHLPSSLALAFGRFSFSPAVCRLQNSDVCLR